MYRSRLHACVLPGAISLALLAACGTKQGGPAVGAAAVDGARIIAADSEPGSWMTYGRTYDEQRFSPLKDINADNVSQLKLAWHYNLDAVHRAQESTPVVVDGVMYVTSAYSKVFALDPATGKQLWVFDPAVPAGTDVKGCCDVANRGVAVWKGKVYVGTYDGRLIAIDARTGKQVWSVLTVDDTQSYTITGAPRIVKGKVIIGNGGGEFGTRGYVSAYDAATGQLVWRFYTVPGPPGKRDGAASDQVLERLARPTWTGDFWTRGGGGNVWDSMAYDPKLDLLYIGTDNGSPWNSAIRSPGGGDNLFIASIIALRPDTGEYVWHYQESPGESWDYSAVQHMILADLTIDGKLRHVIMQAPKNGVFYVLDRATGKLISAKPFTTINWAKGFDPTTGRPIINPDALYGVTGKPFTARPGPSGGHSWQPMSYDPQTHLVYIPAIDISFVYIAQKDFRMRSLGWNTGVDFNAGSLPEDPKIIAQIENGLKGRLLAWDPVAEREVWSVPENTPWNGGVLSTAGNLVFHGNGMGELYAVRATDGKRLWSVETHTGILAPPITYKVGGQQYVAVELGWGGAFGVAAGQLALDKHVDNGNVPRVLAFSLNGTDTMPVPPPPSDRQLAPPPDQASAATISAGKLQYHSYCSVCHGDSAVSGGVLPDLRFSSALSRPALWQNIVHDGALAGGGMVSFKSQLSPAEIETIRAYVIHRANETKTVR